MFIICIILSLSLTEFGTNCTGYARHSQHSSWHVGSPGCDQFAELLYCSEARRALQKFAAPMLVIRKSGSKMPLACIADISKNELVTSLHCDEIKEQKTEIKVSNFYRSTTK